MRNRRATQFWANNRDEKRQAFAWLQDTYGPPLRRNEHGLWWAHIWEETTFGFSIYDDAVALAFKLRWG